jgi:hypothetical protein
VYYCAKPNKYIIAETKINLYERFYIRHNHAYSSEYVIGYESTKSDQKKILDKNTN